MEFDSTILAQYLWSSKKNVLDFFEKFEAEFVGSTIYCNETGMWYGDTINIKFKYCDFFEIVYLLYKSMDYGENLDANFALDFILIEKEKIMAMYSLGKDDAGEYYLISDKTPKFNEKKASFKLLIDIADGNLINLD